MKKSRERIVTDDGSHSILSSEFGVSYHSRYGAIQETRHVFIDAGLKMKALSLSEIDILDIGFGTGLNAYMTLLESRKKGLSVNYHAIEAYPLDLQVISTLNYAEILQLPESQRFFVNLHECEWGVTEAVIPGFNFTKEKVFFESLDFENQFDLIYYDAFAPSAQPELWEEEQMTKMFRALKQGGILVTYCAKGSFKRTLKAIGFTVEAIPGPPGKREMTRALKLPGLEV